MARRKPTRTGNFVTLSVAVGPALYDKVLYDPYRSFDPVTLAASTTVLLRPTHPGRRIRLKT